MLELVNVHTYYGDSHILRGLSLRVLSGQVVGLLGRNGMGKTTTIRSIIGFNPPRAGTIAFKGKEITKLPSHEIARLGIGLVPQGRRIFPSLTVEENLTVAARTNNKENPFTLSKIYDLFPHLKRRARLKGNMLSGGEQQMLCIGRALMTNPDLILMDEPSEGLAPLIIREIAEIIKELKKQKISILLVEQNLQLACSTSDYVYVINKGEIVYESEPKSLLSNEKVKSIYLGVANEK